MKVPNTFVPEKNLEKNIEKMLKERKKFHPKPIINFDKLEIESNYSIYQFSFDKSLKRLREMKYERHLRPWEYFELLVKYHDGTLPEDFHFALEEMLGDYGEWLSMALEKKRRKAHMLYRPGKLNLRQGQRNLSY